MDLVTAAAQILGAGTLGAVLLKVVERWFARADTKDQLAVGLRSELVARLATLETQLKEVETRERDQYRRVVRLENENRQLRRRYHDLIGWMSAQPDLPSPPKWLAEQVDGPTENEQRRRESQGGD